MFELETWNNVRQEMVVANICNVVLTMKRWGVPAALYVIKAIARQRPSTATQRGAASPTLPQAVVTIVAVADVERERQGEIIVSGGCNGLNGTCLPPAPTVISSTIIDITTTTNEPHKDGDDQRSKWFRSRRPEPEERRHRPSGGHYQLTSAANNS